MEKPDKVGSKNAIKFSECFDAYVAVCKQKHFKENILLITKLREEFTALLNTVS